MVLYWGCGAGGGGWGGGKDDSLTDRAPRSLDYYIKIFCNVIINSLFIIHYHYGDILYIHALKCVTLGPIVTSFHWAQNSLQFPLISNYMKLVLFCFVFVLKLFPCKR